MNLNWLKQNSIIVAFVAGFVVLLGAVIWLQQMASSKRAEVDAALDEQSSQLQHLLQTKPAPSLQNIDIVKKDRQQVDRLYSNLLVSVSHSGIDLPPDLRPVNFLQLMASTFSRLHQAADAPPGVKLQDGFAFGFGRYAGPPPTLPARNLPDDETKRVLTLLVKQLRAIDQISALLIESHVDEINQIRRSEVESSSGTETFDVPISSDSKGLYEVLPFEFQFTSTSEALRAFLNALTKSDWFFAVRRVQITGEAPVVERVSTAAAGRGAASAPPTPTVAKRTRLTVTVRLDLIEFNKKPLVKKEAPKKEAPRREEPKSEAEKPDV